MKLAALSANLVIALLLLAASGVLGIAIGGASAGLDAQGPTATRALFEAAVLASRPRLAGQWAAVARGEGKGVFR